MQSLELRAFLIMFTGIVMFFLLTMLPVMYFVDEKLLKLHDINWFVQFAVALVFISAIIAGLSIVLMDTDKDRRVVQLQLAMHYGWNFILRWNLVGWLIWLLFMMSVIVVAMLKVSHRMCHDDKVPGK